MKRFLSVSSSLLLTAGLISSVPTAAQALTPPLPCTISGDARANVLVGTPLDDVICGGDGKDTIYGLGGNDLLLGGTGNDTIFGGEGKDEIIGGSGNDILDGGNEEDIIDGQSGNDFLGGGSGSDTLNGGDGIDNLSGGLGDDILNGGSSNDLISGGDDEDLIRGATGNDKIQGGAGDDRIDGGAGKDSISTNAGDDTCRKDKLDVHLDTCSIDITAPEIGVTTTVIREFTAGQEFTLSWLVSDVSGVSKSWASIGGPSGWVTDWCGFAIEADLVDGDSKQGTYQIKCKAPELAPNQTYTLFVSAADMLGNSTLNATQFSFIIVGGSGDTETPEVLGVQAPEKVGYDATFDVVMQVRDESDIKYVYGWFMLEGGGFANKLGIYIPAVGEGPELISGTLKDGSFRQRFQVSKYTPLGKYNLWISVSDVLGNREMVRTETIVLVSDTQ